MKHRGHRPLSDRRRPVTIKDVCNDCGRVTRLNNYGTCSECVKGTVDA